MRQKEVVIKGTTYKLQSMPFKSYMDILDKCKDKHGNLMQRPHVEALFKHCVIEPKVQMSHFDNDYKAALELYEAIDSFLGGDEDTEEISGESTE